MDVTPQPALIRAVRPDRDAAALARIYEPCVTDTVISFEEIAPTATEMSERARRILSAHPYLVYETEGEVIGFAYAGEHRARAAYRWSVDVTVYVAQAYRRRGVGRALYARLLDILDRQHFHAAFAGVTLPNPGSVGLHEAMGFEHVGICREAGYKLGAWRDVGWWRRSLSQEASPQEPIRFAELG